MGGWTGYLINSSPPYPPTHLPLSTGHGLQQAPAAGRAVAELIVEGRFTSIDLRRLGVERVVENRPLYERNIV